MIYVPNDVTYNKCYVVQNENVIRGYDNFCPDSRTKTIQYNIEYEIFKNVTLLDKGDIT